MELKGKVALITGAASGIGESTALLFAKEGARVFLTDIDNEKGEKLAKKINEDGGEAVFFKADISKAQDSENIVNQAVKKFGKLDIAVNNAGVGGPQLPVGEYPVEGWDKVIAINLSGVFYGMRYQIPEMLKNGKGSIINVASILGSVGFANSAAYEYSAKGIRVNSVGPAFINTPMLKDLDKDLLSQLVNAHPIGRLGEADEVAQLFLWLAGEKSSFATGAYYPIDGGYLAQ